MPPRTSSGDAGPGPAAGVPTTLTAEHALLLDAVTGRASEVLAQADQGRWPQRELQQLLDYLHLEVLRQVVDEEWLLFRNSHHDPEHLVQLRQDHLELRRMIETLAAAAASPDQQSPAQLATTTRGLLTKLQSHVTAEEQLLCAEGEPPSTSAMGGAPHTWFELTDGTLLDLDNLPGPQGVDAVLGRMLRLRAGEQVEVRAGSDPMPIWRRLAMADPGGYGFTYIKKGPPQWRVHITRR